MSAAKFLDLLRTNPVKTIYKTGCVVYTTKMLGEMVHNNCSKNDPPYEFAFNAVSPLIMWPMIAVYSLTWPLILGKTVYDKIN